MARSHDGTALDARSPWPPIVGGLVYGVCVYLSLPPAGLWPLTFVAVVALVWAGCHGHARPVRTAVLCGIGTLPLWFAQQAWLMNVTPVGYPLLAFYLGMWSGVAVWMIARVRRSGWRIPMVVGAPLVWVAVEMLRCELVLGGYAWFIVGQPLIDSPHLALPARLLGVYFVSFLVAALAGSLADAAGWSGLPRRAGGVGASVVALVWLVTGVVSAERSNPTPPARAIKVGIVQTNIPQGQKLRWNSQQQAADFRRFLGLTRAAAAAGAEIVFWPETMFPGYALNDEALGAARAFAASRNAQAGSPMAQLAHEFADELMTVQRELGVPIVVGAEARDGVRVATDPQGEYLASDRKYNSALVVVAGAVRSERYDKVELTPFGEMIPFVWRWPRLEEAVLSLGAGGMKFDLNSGTRAAPITVPISPGGGSSGAATEIQIATPICFEVTRTALCRRLAYEGGSQPRAAMIVNLSNDGWFGSEKWWLVPSDAGRRQHLLAARWRSLELGLPMVRAVNTGVSCVIDGRGRFVPHAAVMGGTAATQADGALVATIELDGGGTIYGRIGNVFGWGAMYAGLGLVTLCVFRRRTGAAAGA